MLQSFNAINSLRQHIRDKARIHGIIIDGGEAANIVPAHTAGSFIVRAEDDRYLDELKERVQEYPPQRVSEITWVAKDEIVPKGLGPEGRPGVAHQE
jgi:acetylornithine deacetylase/succinyl-diaminopimelate desuccinylase-like protein